MAKAPVIQIKNVTKKFTLGSNEVQVLKGIDFEIYSGEYIIFYGASGSGKSTILNTICGLEPPSIGEVIVRGENIVKFNSKQLAKYRRDKIGIVFQQFNLIKSFRVWENVAFPLMNSGEKLKTRRDRALHLLDLLGLGKLAQRFPTELSGGQQQRVAIARALAANAWIIIADEPTGNLDSRSADDVMTIFRILNRKSRRTIIMVTHNPMYLKEADRVFYVKDGLIDRIETNYERSNLGEEVKGLDDLKDLVFHDEQENDKKPKKNNRKDITSPELSPLRHKVIDHNTNMGHSSQSFEHKSSQAGSEAQSGVEEKLASIISKQDSNQTIGEPNKIPASGDNFDKNGSIASTPPGSSIDMNYSSDIPVSSPSVDHNQSLNQNPAFNSSPSHDNSHVETPISDSDFNSNPSSDPTPNPDLDHNQTFEQNSPTNHNDIQQTDNFNNDLTQGRESFENNNTIDDKPNNEHNPFNYG